MNQMERQEVYKDLAKKIQIGIRTAATYPRDHPVGEQAITKPFHLLTAVLNNHGKITLGVSDNRVFVDDLPLDFPPSFINSLAKAFRQRSIDSVTFHHTVSMKDLAAFFNAMKPGRPDQKVGIGSALIREGVSSITFNEIKYGRIRAGAGDQVVPEVSPANGQGEKFLEPYAEPIHVPEVGKIQVFCGELLQELNDPMENTRKRACEKLSNLIAASNGNPALAGHFPEISNALLGRLVNEEDLQIYLLAADSLHKICTSQNRMEIYLTDGSIGHRLFERKQISRDKLQKVLLERKQNSQSLQYTLSSLNFVDEVLITHLLAEQYRGYRAIHVSTIRRIPANVREIVSRDIIQRHQVLPYMLKGEHLYTAMAKPNDWQVIREIRDTLPDSKIYSVIPHLAAEYYLLKGLKRFYQIDAHQKNELNEVLDSIQEEERVEWVEEKQNQVTAEEIKETSAPVVRLVDLVLREAIRKKASDIHIEPGERELMVRLRIDGTMSKLLGTDIRYANAISSRIKVMSRLQIDERRLPQDGRLKVRLDGSSRDLRVSIFPGMFGETVVVRVLNTSDVAFGVKNIGLNEHDLNALLVAMSKAKGMILVTGPTGSGKTTTLYSILHDLNDGTRNICTCEDPIEYNLCGVNQFQINYKIGLDFPRALRALLRQDPDIVMVGEIRDPETAGIAVKAALTGHLVLSTLHTNSASETITRLLDMKVEPYLLSPCLNLIIAQRLMRKICSQCKTRTSVNAFQRGVLASNGLDVGTHPVFKGRGCEHCNHTGYEGRFAVYELLPMTERIQALAENLKSTAEIRRNAKEMGFSSLQEEGFQKVLAGLSSVDEWMRVVA